MSQLIRSRKAVTTAPCSIPPPPTSATTAPVEMEPRPVNLINAADAVAPQVSQVSASSASSVAIPIRASRGHRHPRMPDTTSASITDASAKKNTQGPCCQLKTTKVTRVTNGCITIGYDDRHWAAPTAEQHSALAHDNGRVVRTYCPMQWKSWKAMPDEVRTKLNSDLHQYFETFDAPQVALEKGCPKEFKDQENNWVWLCSHFQEPGYVVWGFKISGDLSLETFMFDPRMSWLSPFIYDDGEEAFGSSGVCLPTSSRDSARVCGSPRGCGVSDLYKDLGSHSRVEANDVLYGGWGMPDGGNLESIHHRSPQSVRHSSPIDIEPLQPEHAQNSAPSTSEPVPNPETFMPQDFQPPSNVDLVDYVALFS
ncbi:hypothetical protein C1H46_034429 [Malus baccata]|uniref:Uncharacterized protein n=1 Tax=Malus baccata TaxID=106549 RepID=A0A540L0K5_MALBA|nr:hypothetical protein C1H46_034429 [Malus baccata]